jgi:hypothetical protein
MRWRGTGVALVALVALQAGCYTYAPVQSAAVQSGATVRAHVSEVASARIAPLLGSADARTLDGVVIDNTVGTIVIEVPTVVQNGINGSLQSLSQRVSIFSGDLVQLETRRLDRSRTGLVVAAAVFIGGSAAIAALKGGPTADKPPTGTSSEARVPLFRLHF